MTLPKHTPGPWVLRGKSHALSICQNDEDGTFIASPHWAQGYHKEANARLIVAACNAAQALANHLSRDPVELAEGLDLVEITTALEQAYDLTARLGLLIIEHDEEYSGAEVESWSDRARAILKDLRGDK